MHVVCPSSTKFLGLIVDDALSWKNHTDYITAKQNSACFAITNVKPLSSKDEFKNVILFLYTLCQILRCNILGQLI